MYDNEDDTRPLSPITERTTPGSFRTIPLPSVDHVLGSPREDDGAFQSGRHSPDGSVSSRASGETVRTNQEVHSGHSHPVQQAHMVQQAQQAHPAQQIHPGPLLATHPLDRQHPPHPGGPLLYNVNAPRLPRVSQYLPPSQIPFPIPRRSTISPTPTSAQVKVGRRTSLPSGAAGPGVARPVTGFVPGRGVVFPAAAPSVTLNGPPPPLRPMPSPKSRQFSTSPGRHASEGGEVMQVPQAQQVQQGQQVQAEPTLAPTPAPTPSAAAAAAAATQVLHVAPPRDEEESRPPTPPSVDGHGIAGVGSGIAPPRRQGQPRSRPSSFHASPPLSPANRSTSHLSLVELSFVDKRMHTDNIPPIITPESHPTLLSIPWVPAHEAEGWQSPKSGSPKTGSPANSRPGSRPGSRPQSLRQRPHSFHGGSSPGSFTDLAAIISASKTSLKLNAAPRVSIPASTSDVFIPRNKSTTSVDQTTQLRSPSAREPPRRRLSGFLSIFSNKSTSPPPESSSRVRRLSKKSTSSKSSGKDPKDSSSSGHDHDPNLVQVSGLGGDVSKLSSAIRASGTFGIRDDGSEMYTDDRITRQRSRSGTTGSVKSQGIKRVLYISNVDEGVIEEDSPQPSYPPNSFDQLPPFGRTSFNLSRTSLDHSRSSLDQPRASHDIPALTDQPQYPASYEQAVQRLVSDPPTSEVDPPQTATSAVDQGQRSDSDGGHDNEVYYTPHVLSPATTNHAIAQCPPEFETPTQEKYNRRSVSMTVTTHIPTEEPTQLVQSPVPIVEAPVPGAVDLMVPASTQPASLSTTQPTSVPTQAVVEPRALGKTVEIQSAKPPSDTVSPPRPLPHPPSQASVQRPQVTSGASAYDEARSPCASSLFLPRSPPIPRLHVPPPPSVSPSPQSTPQTLTPSPAPARAKSIPDARRSAPEPTAPGSDLPLLIASHLLSSQGAALMRHSTMMKDVSDVMHQMARESLEWGNVLLKMSSVGRDAQRSVPDLGGSSHFSEPPPAMGMPFSSNPLQQAWDSLHGGSTQYAQTAQTAQDAPAPASQPHPSAQPTQEALEEQDNFTAIPPRPSQSRKTSRAPRDRDVVQRQRPESMPAGWLGEVDRLGKEGWESLHRAEDAWSNAVISLRTLTDRPAPPPPSAPPAPPARPAPAASTSPDPASASIDPNSLGRDHSRLSARETASRHSRHLSLDAAYGRGIHRSNSPNDSFFPGGADLIRESKHSGDISKVERILGPHAGIPFHLYEQPSAATEATVAPSQSVGYTPEHLGLGDNRVNMIRGRPQSRMVAGSGTGTTRSKTGRTLKKKNPSSSRPGKTTDVSAAAAGVGTVVWPTPTSRAAGSVSGAAHSVHVESGGQGQRAFREDAGLVNARAKKQKHWWSRRRADSLV